jgi:hypothetical protein
MIYLQNLWFSSLLRWSQAKGKCRAHVRLPRFFINLPCWWNVDISSKTLEKAETQQSNAEICLIPLNRYGYKIYKIYKIYNLFIWLKTIKIYKNLRQSPVFCGSKRSFLQYLTMASSRSRGRADGRVVGIPPVPWRGSFVGTSA